MSFKISLNTSIEYNGNEKSVLNAVSILERDIAKCFDEPNAPENKIVLAECEDMADEAYVIEVNSGMTVRAKGDLGFVYGLLRISEEFLGIKPFWFWLDQKLTKTCCKDVADGTYTSKTPAVKYRGWFINDEVLIMKWQVNGDRTEPWRMALEALLRCGGNTVIPGTDKNSRIYRSLATEMGLWITHHHAEPLGAEMFVRAYPDEEPNYAQKPEMFYKLWEDAVEEQKDMKVVWCLGFRGQGDCPFWSNDSSGRFDTDAKRGKAISDVIELQRQMVMKKVSNPVFCTNLYGEIMELYEAGYINFADDIIKVGADNGYGKMVTRRRDNHSPRISSMPKKPEVHGGIYYHASFYDLQAANHITMLPNTVDFVNRELNEVKRMNAVDLWVINCSNIRPHAYYLDAIAKKWFGGEVSDETHSREFAATYYDGNESVAKCLESYAKSMTAYGEHEDEHAGEQFYNENVRLLIGQYIRDKNAVTNRLRWLTGDKPLSEQVRHYSAICENGLAKTEEYYNCCVRASESLDGELKQLFDATVLLQAKIIYFCCKGVTVFAKAYEALENKEYLNSFMLLGDSASLYDAANDAMKVAEYGVWQGFYFNECFADVKHTAYMIRKLMGIVRELGDNPTHDTWYRKAVYAPEDRGVYALLVLDNHMEEWDLYMAFKKEKLNETIIRRN